MVGYPGESEEDFELLLNFINEAKLDRVGGFIYSDEEGTKARGLKKKVPLKVKEKRFDEFMEQQRGVSLKKLEDMVGREVDVLVEGKIDDSTYFGRTEYDAPEVDGIFYLTAKNLTVNSIVKAKVTDSLEYDLIGEIS